nr:B-box zinc finger protein [Candidatus Sigynarchaeota archaeon]
MMTGKIPYKSLEPPGGAATPDRPEKNPPILCKVHRARIEGLNYFCRKCGSVFCLACITNVLLPEGKCMVCNADLEISDEYRRLIERALRMVGPRVDGAEMEFPGMTVTTLAPEIWKRFDELQLDDDIIEEVIDKLKYIPPDDRLKYLDAYFGDDLDANDDP